MASRVWFLVIVLISIQDAFANDCNSTNIQNIMNCNECIRCGGFWCSDPKEAVKCTSTLLDYWCSSGQEILPSDSDPGYAGTHINPIYSMQSVKVRSFNTLGIKHTSTTKGRPKVAVSIVNTTQNFEFELKNETSCNDGGCLTTIKAMPKANFCSPTSRTMEYVNVRVKIYGLEEDALVKYHVPCACECSDEVEKFSKKCNRRGHYSCGVCACQSGWHGESCELSSAITDPCGPDRGDLRQCKNPSNNMECSGNGKCGQCETCECFTDREGSQYFDQDNYCADICLVTNECDQCMRNPTPGLCQSCHFSLFNRMYNESLMEEKDQLDRNVWVKCSDSSEECRVEYAAMKDENQDTHFMVISLCEAENAAQAGGVNVTLPIVLIAICAALAMAGAAGYIMWKNRSPPLSPTDPMYQNIDAEDCRGENPLYKPPTSSYKNPTYGKW